MNVCVHQIKHCQICMLVDMYISFPTCSGICCYIVSPTQSHRLSRNQVEGHSIANCIFQRNSVQYLICVCNVHALGDAGQGSWNLPWVDFSKVCLIVFCSPSVQKGSNCHEQYMHGWYALLYVSCEDMWLNHMSYHWSAKDDLFKNLFLCIFY